MFVNVEHLEQSGIVVTDAADEANQRQSATDQAIAHAFAGLVGRSAAAMQTKATRWTDATRILHEHLTGHGQKFTTAAGMYLGTDDAAAGVIGHAARPFEQDVG